MRESYLSRVLLVGPLFFMLMCHDIQLFKYPHTTWWESFVVLYYRLLYLWTFRHSVVKTNFKCDHSVESLFFFSVRQWPFLRSLLAASRNLGCQDPNSAKSVCDLRRCRGRAAGLSIKPGGLALPESQVWI